MPVEVKYVRRCFIAMIVLLCAAMTSVANVHSHESQNHIKLVNNQLSLLFDSTNKITISEAIGAYKNQAFIPNEKAQVSFGFTDDTIWAMLPINNESRATFTQIIKIDNAWLDEIDIFFVQNNKVLDGVSLGDELKFTQRPLSRRMPAVLYEFSPGQTEVYFRIRSKDPLTIPIYIGSEESHSSVATTNAYFYGVLYGALIILLIYNLVLFSYLREQKYLFYSAYLFAFTIFNFTYTGHGFWSLWPDSVLLQQSLMPVLMFVYLYSGVVFTIEFLDTRKYVPSLYAVRRKIYSALLGLALVLILVNSRSLAIMVQLVILTSLSLWMLVIGYSAYKNGNPSAKCFVPAVLMGTGGATISSLATWGIIPYSQWAFRGIEIGILMEMSLLSVSLGFNFKMVQQAMKNAESNAMLDPLTNLYNRRAFSELVHPLWELGKRNKTPMAIMLIDLDWFKRINDKYGHDIGDEVLEAVGVQLKQRLRDSDIALRWGGEEFLIFLPNTDNESAVHLAETLRQYFDSTNIRSRQKVTMSVGVVS